MTIKLLARELYRSQKAVEALENELALASYDKHAQIKEKLRKARGEMDYLRRALDGEIGR